MFSRIIVKIFKIIDTSEITQDIVLKIDENQRATAFVQTGKYLPHKMERKNASIILTYWLFKLEKIVEPTRLAFFEKRIFYGKILKKWIKRYSNLHSEFYALLDTGKYKINLCLSDPKQDYPVLNDGDYVKVYDGRLDLDAITIISKNFSKK